MQQREDLLFFLISGMIETGNRGTGLIFFEQKYPLFWKLERYVAVSCTERRKGI